MVAQSEEWRSPRNANYKIWVSLDSEQRKIEGREVITWRNRMNLPTGELWFHLYYNAWINDRSTWLRENSLQPFRGTWRFAKEDWGYCTVKSIKVLAGESAGEVDLTEQVRFAAPDDGNPDDRTVLVLTLPQSVAPGESLDVEVLWESKIPRTFARTGFRGNFFFLAHWFPKLGVYQLDGSWNCHQFHAATEFFSDYGVYDVQITIPSSWKVGATGVRLGVTHEANETSTHRFKQEDVHDFAWTTSPDYREATDRFEVPGLPVVEMRLLYQPEHENQVQRHFRAAKAALRYYGTWYGVYPYGHITLVDPAWGSGVQGMEYPTLFTCGTRYWNPEGGGSPEGVTVHEAGHQFWYGLVGNNEFEDAWLDEGLNSFSTDRTMAMVFGPSFYVRRFFRSFLPVVISGIGRHRMNYGHRVDWYRRSARRDTQASPTYRYFPSTANAITYHKTALWLATLERTLGWNRLQRILSTFFQRWKFRHPTPQDFFAVVDEVGGEDLTSFFDQVYRKSVLFDFSVESVSSQEVKTKGWIEKDGRLHYLKGEDKEDSGNPQNREKLYETRVVVRRLQDGILPVEVLFVFDNDEELRDVWDATNEWKSYQMVKPAKLRYAVVDPDRKILLDINYGNNSRLLKPGNKLPAMKWASRWMFWLQDYLQTLSFLF